MNLSSLTIFRADGAHGRTLPDNGAEPRYAVVLGDAITARYQYPLASATLTVTRAPAGSSATPDGASFTPDVVGWYRLRATNGGATARAFVLAVFPAAALEHPIVATPAFLGPGYGGGPRNEMGRRRLLQSATYPLDALDALTTESPIPLGQGTDWSPHGRSYAAQEPTFDC